MQCSLAWCSGIEGLWVGRCVVRSRQRIGVIGFVRWRRVSLEQECKPGIFKEFWQIYPVIYGHYNNRQVFQASVDVNAVLIRQLWLRTSWEWERLWLVDDSSSSEDSSESWGSSWPRLGVLPECWLSSNRSPSSVLSRDRRRTPQLKLSTVSP